LWWWESCFGRCVDDDYCGDENLAFEDVWMMMMIIVMIRILL
jgi:hypothetical protein